MSEVSTAIVFVAGWILLALAILHVLAQWVMYIIRRGRRMIEIGLWQKVYAYGMLPLLYVPPIVFAALAVQPGEMSWVWLPVGALWLFLGCLSLAMDFAEVREAEHRLNESIKARMERILPQKTDSAVPE